MPVLIASLLVIFLLFHPNDARLPSELSLTNDSATSAPAGALSQSALRGDLSVENSMPLPAILAAKKKWALEFRSGLNAFDVRVQSESARFLNLSQLRLSLGVYPGRVQARDGIFVPPGESLRVKIANPIEGSIRFGVAAISGSASFDADLDGAKVVSWKESPTLFQNFLRSAGRLEPRWTSALFKIFIQFIRPVSAAESLTGREWDDLSVALPETSRLASDIVLKCGPASSCIFSDITYISGGSESGKSQKVERPQNFIVVLVDTLRSDGVLSPGAPLPFQKFVRESASFSNASSPGNMTSPSTNALLGCHTPTEMKGIAFAYAVDDQSREAHYRSKIASFPKMFSDHGYETAMIGNISVVSEVIGGGISHGFTESISIETEGYETALAAIEAGRWIKTHKGSPFFLYVHLNAPHAPYKAPLSDVLAMWPGMSALGSMQSALKWLYRAEVNYAARSFQKILDVVESESISEFTNVVLLADHGDQQSSRTFRGNEAGPPVKGAFFDHGATLLSDEVGVPLVWRGPGVVLGDHPHPVSTIGLGPAMLRRARLAADACGFSSRQAGDGLFANLTGDAAATSTFGIEAYQQRAVVFDARWKYIRAHEPTQKKLVPVTGWKIFPSEIFIREELYDLKADHGESRNLALDSNAWELLARARHEYEKFYDVGTGFELVVEAPHGEPVRVPVLGHESSGKVRVVLPLTSKAALDSLQVFVGGKPLKISSMAWRLPLSQSQWIGLPREFQGDESLLPVSHIPSAYLRRVPVNDTEVRRIVTGNPMFDSILREWGYLHDD